MEHSRSFYDVPELSKSFRNVLKVLIRIQNVPDGIQNILNAKRSKSFQRIIDYSEMICDVLEHSKSLWIILESIKNISDDLEGSKGFQKTSKRL